MKPIQNPPNPFESENLFYFDDVVPPAKLEVYEDSTRSILAENKSPDLGFRWSLNPYRGCQHACAYCYARPSHEYLGFGAGTDFETKIVIKRKAPELLKQTFMKKSWKGELIVFSGDTDCYQPLEASYRLTRQCLEVCHEFGNPVSIITKSFLITRDLDLLKRLHDRTHLNVVISIPFFDEKTARLVEPHAASISRRFDAVKMVSDLGICVSVNVAPIIPGLSDSDIPMILKKAKECGAKSASPVLLRLPGSVKEVFLLRMKRLFPLAYRKIENRIRETREGRLYNSEFGRRHRGKGAYWDNIEKMFYVHAEKLGFNQDSIETFRLPFSRPSWQKELLFN